eukprot:CAMPEP_0116111940 /NCGR_PEP_ID=MMETSP0327-20121206/18713_1 /TAXON_ID=44447 /ORGANISM="Pseudo-nitzschia delicatissima, Strain B596" /LENGTH=161 /DNA_ID=CAMNT_0003605205 /DNA_START=54 /DNA_END=539 /DNA_ORIENTATION=+
MKQYSFFVAIAVVACHFLSAQAFVGNGPSTRSSVISSTSLGAGPLQKFTNRAEYNKVVDGLMFTKGLDRADAEKEYDAFLQNPNDYALNKGEAYYKSLGYKNLMEGVIGEAEKEGRGDEVRARVEKFNQDSFIKGMATITFFILLGFYAKMTNPYVPPGSF